MGQWRLGARRSDNNAACPVSQGAVVIGNMMDFMRVEKGVTVIEYAVIVMLIALGLVGSLMVIGSSVTGFYQSVATLFP
ncbi:MAG TPA: Flp family type IVb pilin [Syntrophorhabdales bacterium]|nr:Flp family type IVb pilin [Syntrophorhabdales bacterium]